MAKTTGVRQHLSSPPSERMTRIQQLQSEIDATTDESVAAPLADELHDLLDEADRDGELTVALRGAEQQPADHRDWCCEEFCSSDTQAVEHESVASSVVVATDGLRRQLDVRTELRFEAQMTGQAAELGPFVRFQEKDKGDLGYQMTPTEARQLAQALNNHADMADGVVDPGRRAATLIVSMLAHTGRDPNTVHDRVADLVDAIVSAMAGAR